MHIRFYRISASGPQKQLTPTQTSGILSCRSKTPVAQMHFASELPLSQGSHGINGQKITIQANPRET
jgi:hypothetical protein